MTLPRSPFASASVPRHLARGGAGLLALGGGLLPLHAGGLFGMLGAAAAVGLAVVLLRGCPMCWIIGLIETVALRAPHDHTALVTSREGEHP